MSSTVLAVAALLSSAVGAQASSHRISLSGFGTLGVVHSSEDRADFVADIFQPDGAGYTDGWAVGVDSKLGVQLDAIFSDRLSGVIQVVSRQYGDGGYAPEVEWANLKYQVDPDLSVRAGRSVFPEFLVSDFRLVSYANPWVRPPVELYSTVPVTKNDGVDITYQLHFGRMVYRIQALYGRVPTQATGSGAESTGRNNWGLAHTVEYGPVTVHLGYTTAKVTQEGGPLSGLFAGFTQIGNTLSGISGAEAAGAKALDIVNEYQVKDVKFADFTLGISYDPGRWLLMAEWARGRRYAVFSDSYAAYVTGGYRIGDFTPYITLARQDHEDKSEPGIPTTGLDADLAQAAAGLNAGLNAVLHGIASSQDAVSIGARWDFTRNAALKLQYDRVNLGPDSAGSLVNVQPDFEPGGTVNLFSLAVDFVF